MAKSTMSLGELLHETDALTYINALKVTLTEIKDEISTQEELRDYMNQSGERARKLLRRADGQYRLIAKLVNREIPVASDLIVEDSIEQFDALKEQMENNG